jgi:RND superfamily putative drug exporter
VITGAALIMTGVFVAFAAADIVSLREYGIGLTVAVVLDATLVRLVLLPAAIRLLGDRAWWIPRWLDRRLPEVELEREHRETPRFVREEVAVA